MSSSNARSNIKTLPSFSRLELILEDGLVPSSRKEPSWTKKAIASLAVNTPEAQEPLQEAVLALWRLKETAPSEDESEEDEVWARHVSAWLVSSLQFCRSCSQV